MKLVRYIFGVLVPPVGVALTYGIGPTLVINILLTLLGYVPGIIHAVWAIAKHDEKLSQQIARQQEANQKLHSHEVSQPGT